MNEEEMAQAPAEAVTLSRFKNYLTTSGRTYGVIHFAKFETPFLREWLSCADTEFPFKTICTFEIARRLLPDLPSRGIRGLAGYFGVPASNELKRAAAQIQATRVIWQGLLPLLQERGIQSLEELQNFLESPVPKKTKHVYQLPAEKRLTLPDSPGIYKMLGRDGTILYVGKATSLKDRVNSYFRGRKGRDPKKLEMLTQVWDLETVSCDTPLEAALLETDEIKRLDPPYNISLKSRDRKLYFYDRTLVEFSNQETDRHRIGPFTSEESLRMVLRIARAPRENAEIRFSENPFYDPIELELVQKGFDRFLELQSLSPDQLRSPRSVLALGLHCLRNLPPEDENIDSKDETDETEIEVTPETIAEKFLRHLASNAETYLRARSLAKYLNSEWEIPFQGKTKRIRFQNGVRTAEDQLTSDETSSREMSWRGLGVSDYDRMIVLRSGIEQLTD